MRILLVGLGDYPQYEAASADALGAAGHEVVQFAVARYWRPSLLMRAARYCWGRQYFGALNRDLTDVARRLQPDAIYFRRCVEVTRDTLRELRRRTGATLVSYMNDDPFGMRSRHPMWKLFVEAIPEYDIHFTFREANVTEFYARGAKRCSVLLPYFVPSLHQPMTVAEDEAQRFRGDATFIGHFAPDHRGAYLLALARAGLDVRVFGPGWGTRRARRVAGTLRVGEPLWGRDYARALCASRVCLCFYDHANRDTITTRNMEVPASGSVLVAERSHLATSIHVEGREALFFDSPSELVDIVRHLKRHPEEVARLSSAGLAWARRGEHTVEARMRRIVAAVEDVRGMSKLKSHSWSA